MASVCVTHVTENKKSVASCKLGGKSTCVLPEPLGTGRLVQDVTSSVRYIL